MKITGHENTPLIMKELGQRIKDTRIAASLTREELALKSGASLSTVVRAENGSNVGFDQMINIIRALGSLSNIDLLLAEYKPSPVDIANGKKKRQRASAAKTPKGVTWKWGDEK